ncbi:MAG: triple tyrosine motif-containing protein [Balneolaceae bacterium]
MMRFSFILLIFLMTGFLDGIAQISFQISNYSINEPRAGNQNWDISTDDSQRIFVANNNGLLIHENTDFHLYELPERNIFRSVAYINDRIFTGSFEEFGYWEKDDSDELIYHSLVPLLENSDMNNDEIWKIIEHDGKVYFHSFGSVYCYDQEEVYRIEIPGSLMFPHKVGEEIFIQKIQGSLYRLQNGEFVKMPGSKFLQNEEVKSIIDLPGNSKLIGTSNGLYTYNGESFKEWRGEKKDEVIRNKINKMVRTEDKIIVGTILNGLYIYDLKNKLLKNINTQNQLQNNTILSLAVDQFENIWVGMDKGLDYIAFDSPIHTYRDELNDIGSIYAAALYENELYVGTNQGIYWYKRDNQGNFYDKTLIPDSQGQVWFINEFDGLLYSGLNDGTYLIEDKELKIVGDVHGGYTLKPYPNNQNILLQSTYSDFVVYQKNSNIWEQAYSMTGFSSPARFMEFDHMGNIWLGHTVKGIFQLQPNIQFDKIEHVRKISASEGLTQNTNKVFKLGNRIMTSFADTLYQWDAIHEHFIPYTNLDEFFTEKGTVRNILPAGNQRYWVVKRSEINLFEIHFNSIQLLYRILPQMYNYNLVEDYENVIPLNENLHFFCLDDGFAILDLKLANQSKYPIPSVNIRSVLATTIHGESVDVDPVASAEENLSYRNNTLKFNWSTSQVAGNLAFFQYKLDGMEASWSDWTSETQANYLRLPSGSYIFQVRSIGTNGLLSEVAAFPFTIKKPWYLSNVANVFYLLLIASFGLMIRLYNSRKRWKALGVDLEQKHKNMLAEREKAEKEIIKLNNEKLQAEISHKSAQLASNTMAMMRKNNLLNTVKDELQKQKQELGAQLPNKYFKQLTELIEKGIENENEWEIFEQLYNEAHGDFFKRLKKTYPQLTPSDLRLCAYLRMNLSSKEIAPLLNISVRGVEERRYRLRKRLELSTDTNLTELIMTF